MSENKDLLLQQLQSLLTRKRSKAYYAERLGITPEEVEKLLLELKQTETEEPLQETWVARSVSETSIRNQLIEKKVTEQGKAMEIKALWSNEPSDPDEIEKHHKIDKTKWKLHSYWSKWNGKQWLVSAYFKCLEIDQNLEAQKKILLEEIKEYQSQFLERPYLIFKPQSEKDDLLLEISIFDPHFGKLAWAEETGEDYDLQIAEERFKNAVNELVGRVDNLDKVSRIHLPLGNDLFNIDSSENTTTAGTPQDSDSRFAKLVQRVKILLVEVIDALSTIAPVDVSIVPGNHDSHSAFMLGEILDAWYHNDPRININNSPKWRKYYIYGKNSFLYTHGDKEKHADLGIIFATEEPELWAASKYRFAKVGHFHSNKKVDYVSVEDKTGFQIQILPSLSGTDEWHYSKGYLSNKQAKAYLYHKEKGEIASYTYNV